MESQIGYGVVMSLVFLAVVIAKRTSSEVRAIQRYARARGIAMDRPWEFHVVRRGVAVRVRAMIARHGKHTTDVTAKVVVGSGLQLADGAHAAWPLPIVGTAEAWASVRTAHAEASATCDGTAVRVRVPWNVASDEVLDAMIELAALLARWDDGLTDTLYALPGAAPLEEHELVPGAVLAPDDLMIGVRKGAETVAQVAGGGLAAATATITDGVVATDGELPALAVTRLPDVGTAELLVVASGARLTWPHVERDPARLRAGVDVLRAVLGAAGPYR